MQRFYKIMGKSWSRFWMMFAGISPCGRAATRLAACFFPPYYGRHDLAWWNPKGYVSPNASIHHSNLNIGSHIFIDDRVLIYEAAQGGPVTIGDRVHIYRDCIIQTGAEGNVKICADTFIQPRCIFSAFKSPIIIGSRAQIAPNCSFYSYDHSFYSGIPVIEQPLKTRGGIIVKDDVWLGLGVAVLDGVTIGKGAVIGAGSIVTKNIPDEAIAVGTPARVIKMRHELQRREP